MTSIMPLRPSFCQVNNRGNLSVENSGNSLRGTSAAGNCGLASEDNGLGQPEGEPAATFQANDLG